MDIGGINRIRNLLPSQAQPEVRRNSTATDRDAQGGAGYQKREQVPAQLSTEQEEAAVKKLNELPAFSRAGLTAELVRQEGAATHVVVKDRNGAVVRHIAYEQLVALYVDRHSEGETGRLLRRAA